jgi:hypothetical protein
MKWASALCLLLCAGQAQAATCDALVLSGLDTSSSIDADELRIETDGIAEAFRSPNLLRMIQRGPKGCIAVAVFLWASDAPVTVLDWTIVGNEQQAAQAASALQDAIAKLNPSPAGPLTDTASALSFAYAMFAASPVMAGRQIANIVTDDSPNMHPESVAAARQALLSAGAQINAVAIGTDPSLLAYLQSQVIGGRGAFVMPIAASDGMNAAMLAKFQLDISMVTE